MTRNRYCADIVQCALVTIVPVGALQLRVAGA